MHYLQMLVSEQQKNAKNYKVKQTVYMIVIMTLPYKFDDLKGEAVIEEVIVTKFCSKNLKGKEIAIYGHQMVCLNPNYPDRDTPQAIRDWLDLFYQSMHSPERPSINWNNPAVKRAAELIDYEHLTPAQRKEAKEKEQGEMVRRIYMKEGVKEKSIQIAKRLISKGNDNQTIIDITELTYEEIEQLRMEE